MLEDLLRGAREEASRAFIRNWFSLRRGRLVPDRRDIDPAAIAPLLPKVWLWDRAPDGDDFICRLVGDDITVTFGRNPRGSRLSQWVPWGVAVIALGRYRRVVDEPAICIAAGPSYIAGNKRAWCERVITPMTSGGDGRPSVVFGISTWQVPEFALGQIEREETEARFFPLGATPRPEETAT